jgi:Holliday junction resolvase RusA-like endonuclease
MTFDVLIEVPLPPKGKGRPRATRTGRVYTPAETRRWETTLAMMAAERLPEVVLEGPLRVDVLAVLPRPKRLLRKSDPDGLLWAPAKPDTDNVVKALLDALKAFWRDDAQVVELVAHKVYAERDGRPRMVIRIRSAGDVRYAATSIYHLHPAKKEAMNG